MLPMSEDEIMRAYCQYIVTSSLYQDGKVATEKAAQTIVQIVENGNNLINLGSRKLWLSCD